MQTKTNSQTQIAIIGGGLAGLASAIRLKNRGLSVVLIEKNEYPFHRVCGEYISNETLPYLSSLGLDPFALGAIRLDKFWLTSPSGNRLELDLPLGGFGISRYTLDYELAKIAKKQGVEVLENTFVKNVEKKEKGFTIQTSKGELESSIVIGAYGKRSNLDGKLQRDFAEQNFPYIGVKYHLQTDVMPDNVIALHNFWRGYCGISRIEDDKFCFCYLSHKANLNDFKKIEQLEEKLFSENPFLRDLIMNANFVYEKPEIINQVSFYPKKLIEDDILMCGDSAGMITPLCGNGMAMALHSSKILTNLLFDYFDGRMSFQELKKNYKSKWKRQFSLRLKAGRTVQRFFGGRKSSEMLVKTFKNVPSLGKQIVKLTHGKEF